MIYLCEIPKNICVGTYTIVLFSYPHRLGHFIKSGTYKEHDFGYLKIPNYPALDRYPIIFFI